MSFLARLFGSDKADGGTSDDSAIASVQEQSLAALSPSELSVIEAASVKSVSLPLGGEAAAMVDALMPLTANAAQAAQEYGMAVVKFPDGVGWADLCVRNDDGLKLLANIKGGKFNRMAGLKQAKLQPAAAVNLVLQGAAIVVGMAYMNQISDKLDGLQSGIEEIQRDMQRERDAEIEAAYGALTRLVLKYEEYVANAEKRQAAQGIIENALFQADKAWRYQLKCMVGLSTEIQNKPKLSEKEIIEDSNKLAAVEGNAAIAFELYIAAQQVGKRLDNNYSEQSIAKDRRLAEKMADEFSDARSAAYCSLSKKISKVGGMPLVLADCEDDSHEGDNFVFAALHDVGQVVNRVNPVRMRIKAKAEVSKKRKNLHGAIANEDVVGEIARRNEAQLEELRFAFNEADTVVVKPDSVAFYKLPKGEARNMKG